MLSLSKSELSHIPGNGWAGMVVKGAIIHERPALAKQFA